MPVVQAAPTPHATQSRILLGIGLALIAHSIFPVMNVFGKSLAAAGYSTIQISWFRFLGHVLAMLLIFVPASGWRFVLPRRPAIQFTRSTLQCASNVAFNAGLATMAMASVTSITMIGPLLVVILAWPLLGERTPLRQLGAVLMGFAGVVIIVRPGSEMFEPSALLLLFSTVCYAFDQILIRKTAGIDSPQTTTFYTCAFGAVGLVATLPWVWTAPATAGHMAMFAGMGIIGAAGHYCVVRALSYAPPNLISPFQYFQLVGAVTLGYLVFGDFPDLATWIGAALVVAAGLLVGWSSARR